MVLFSLIIVGSVLWDGEVKEVKISVADLPRISCEQAMKVVPQAIKDTWGQNISFHKILCVSKGKKGLEGEETVFSRP